SRHDREALPPGSSRLIHSRHACAAPLCFSTTARVACSRSVPCRYLPFPRVTFHSGALHLARQSQRDRLTRTKELRANSRHRFNALVKLTDTTDVHVLLM